MLSVLTSPDLKRKTQTAAAATGRSLSAEAEYRLETTFSGEDQLGQAAALAWGGNAPLVFLFAEVVDHIAPKNQWQSDEFAKDSLCLGLRHTLDVLADPEGTVIERHSDGAGRAQALLYRLANPNSPWGAAKRQRLGHLVELIDRRADVLDRALAQEPNPLEQGDSDALDLWQQIREPHLRAAAEHDRRQEVEHWEAGEARRASARQRREDK